MTETEALFGIYPCFKLDMRLTHELEKRMEIKLENILYKDSVNKLSTSSDISWGRIEMNNAGVESSP